MRWTAPLAASLLAAGAWIACWQQVQLVRLKDQMNSVRATAMPVEQGTSTRLATAAPLVQSARPEVALHQVAYPAPRPLDRLQGLLAERKRAVADARDAAAQFGIPAGPEMDQAIAFSTADLDQAIAKLIGPEAVAQLAEISQPVVPVAPMVPAPVAPAPVYVTVNPAPVYVTVAAPAPIIVASAPAPADPQTEVQPATYLATTGAGGLGYAYQGRGERHKPTQAEQLKQFAAGAGIPLTPSPLAAVATTSPLLLMRQRTGR